MPENEEMVGRAGEMKFHSFEDSIKFGKKGEVIFKNRFNVLFRPIVEAITFEENPTLQRSGIDCIVNKERVKFDVKCREYKSFPARDILLETISVRERNKGGWLWTSESDAIVYLWLDEEGKSIVDGYLIFLKQTREWLKDKVNKYSTKIAHSVDKLGNNWSTENIAVPIEDFPDNCLLRIPERYISEVNKAVLFKNLPEDIIAFSVSNEGEQLSLL